MFNFLQADSLNLRLRTDVHLLRKLWHCGCGLIGLYFYFASGLTQKEWVPLILTLAFVSLTVDILRIRSARLNKFIMIFMGPFMRESERDSISGFPFYALGVGLALAFYEEKVAILAVLFLIFADPISSFVGIKFGKTKILPNKSLEGSLAGFFVCFLATAFYTSLSGEITIKILLFSILCGIVGTLSEFLSQKIDDNLTIPLISGLGISVLNGIFQIL
jgi:diacylglycerol kinase (CTP)